MRGPSGGHAKPEAVQEAKEQGLALRAMAKEQGVSRTTVRKYAAASPPVKGDGVSQSSDP